MSQVHQIAPSPHQLEAIDLPDDGARVIETTGVEILDRWSITTLADADEIPASNDNAIAEPDAAEIPAEVVPFAATLPRI